MPMSFINCLIKKNVKAYVNVFVYIKHRMTLKNSTKKRAKPEMFCSHFYRTTCGLRASVYAGYATVKYLLWKLFSRLWDRATQRNSLNICLSRMSLLNGFEISANIFLHSASIGRLPSNLWRVDLGKFEKPLHETLFRIELLLLASCTISFNSIKSQLIVS